MPPPYEAYIQKYNPKIQKHTATHTYPETQTYTHPSTHIQTYIHTHTTHTHPVHTKVATASPVFTSTRSGKGMMGSKWMSSLGTTSPSSPSSPPPPFPNSCCPAPAQWNGFPESVNNKGGSVSVSTPTEYIHKHTDVRYGRGDACRIMSRCMCLYPVATELVTWQCQCVSTDRICPQAQRHKIQQKRCLQNNVTVHVPSHSRYCQAWDIKSNLSREAVQVRIICLQRVELKLTICVLQLCLQRVDTVTQNLSIFCLHWADTVTQNLYILSSVSSIIIQNLSIFLSSVSRYCNSEPVHILSSVSRYRNSELVCISVFSGQIL